MNYEDAIREAYDIMSDETRFYDLPEAEQLRLMQLIRDYENEKEG